MEKTIGEKIHPILEEIEGTIWEFEINVGAKPCYPDESLQSATKIFMSVLMDKMWNLQESEKMSMEVRSNMVTKAGKEMRGLIKTFTDIDTSTFYKQ